LESVLVVGERFSEKTVEPRRENRKEKKIQQNAQGVDGDSLSVGWQKRSGRFYHIAARNGFYFNPKTFLRVGYNI
jgi:hypothetical protein